MVLFFLLFSSIVFAKDCPKTVPEDILVSIRQSNKDLFIREKDSLEAKIVGEMKVKETNYCVVWVSYDWKPTQESGIGRRAFYIMIFDGQGKYAGKYGGFGSKPPKEIRGIKLIFDQDTKYDLKMNVTNELELFDSEGKPISGSYNGNAISFNGPSL